MASLFEELIEHLKVFHQRNHDQRKHILKEAAEDKKIRNRETKWYSDRGVLENILHYLYVNNALFVPSVSELPAGQPGQLRSLVRRSTNPLEDQPPEKKAQGQHGQQHEGARDR